jgi:two-component system sensor histidine kinase CpxA
MRGLLVKIFLWFWLALTAIAAAVVATILLFENSPYLSAARATIRHTMTAYARQAVAVYERDGAAAAAGFLADLEASSGIQAELLDARGGGLTGRAGWPAEDEINSLARQALQLQSGAYRIARREARAALTLRSPQGAMYCFAAKLPPGYLQGWRPDWRAVGLRLLLALCIAGLVCYGLARYLAKPILQLRQATRRIAAGDLTARVNPLFTRRRDEIAGLAQDFNRMADRLAALVEGHRRLLGDISHELRSPLTRLNIALALARQQTGTLAQTEHDRIEIEAERLNVMIGQLLALARAEDGAEQVADEPIRLDRLLREIAADADFEARGRQCSVAVTQAVEATFNGPPALLRSAIENVVRNAVHYTAPGTQVQIELQRAPEGLVIRVRDHGPGAPEEALEKLFQPFYRVGEARDRESGGAGLGLAITARTVGLLGGAVAARNQAEGGLCVEIRLPL